MFKIPPQYYSLSKFFCFLIRASGNLFLLLGDEFGSFMFKTSQAPSGPWGGSSPADISPGAPRCPQGPGVWPGAAFLHSV